MTVPDHTRTFRLGIQVPDNGYSLITAVHDFSSSSGNFRLVIYLNLAGPTAPAVRRHSPCLQWQTKLPLLHIHRSVEGIGNVLGNFTSRACPQPLLWNREPYKGPAGSLLDQVSDPFGGDHARHQLKVA